MCIRDCSVVSNMFKSRLALPSLVVLLFVLIFILLMTVSQRWYEEHEEDSPDLSHRSATPRKRGTVSSFEELGGWGKDFADAPVPAGGSRERLVRMHNVCYSRSKHHFLLFMHPTRRRVPLSFSHVDRTAYVLDRSCWVDLHPQAQANGDTDSCLRPIVVYSPIPNDAEWHFGVSTLHTMRSSDKNRGDFLLDQMMNSYLQQWAWYNRAFDDNTMVFTHVEDTSQTVSWLSTFRPFWYDSPEIALRKHVYPNDLLCFETLLAGAGAVRHQALRAISSSILTSQRDFLFRRAGFDAHARATEHLVAFYVKDSVGQARSIGNAPELILRLQKKFEQLGYTYNGLKIRFVHGQLWNQGFKSELELLSKCTVLITPPGDVSLSALYLRSGASMVLFDWWCTEGGSCRHAFDANIWSKFPDRYIRYYHVDASELRGEPARLNINAVYHLNADKLAEAVVDGLEMADRQVNPRSQ